jgi:hypothetical protein
VRKILIDDCIVAFADKIVCRVFAERVTLWQIALVLMADNHLILSFVAGRIR